MKKQLLKKLSAFLVAAAICVSGASAILAAPVDNGDGTFTVKTEAELKECLEAGKSAKLSANIAVNGTIQIAGKNITIDGQNRYTITATGKQETGNKHKIFTDSDSGETSDITFQNIPNLTMQNGEYGIYLLYHNLVLENTTVHAKNMINAAIYTGYSESSYVFANLTVKNSKINVQDGVKQAYQTQSGNMPSAITACGKTDITGSTITTKNMYASLMFCGTYNLPATITNSTVNVSDFSMGGIYVAADMFLNNSTVNVNSNSANVAIGIEVKGLWSVTKSTVNFDVCKSTYTPGEGFDGTLYCGGLEIDNSKMDLKTNKSLFVYGATVIKGSETDFRLVAVSLGTDDAGAAITGFGRLEIDNVKYLDISTTGKQSCFMTIEGNLIVKDGKNFSVYKPEDLSKAAHNYDDATFEYVGSQPVYGGSGDGPGSVVGYTDPAYNNASSDTLAKMGAMDNYARITIGTASAQDKDKEPNTTDKKDNTKKENTTDDSTTDNTKAPDTGDKSLPFVFLITLLAAGVVIGVKIKKAVAKQ